MPCSSLNCSKGRRKSGARGPESGKNHWFSQIAPPDSMYRVSQSEEYYYTAENCGVHNMPPPEQDCAPRISLIAKVPRGVRGFSNGREVKSR